MYLLSEGQVVHSSSIYNSVKPFINRASPWFVMVTHTLQFNVASNMSTQFADLPTTYVSFFVCHPFWQIQSSYILVTGDLTPQYKMEWDLMKMHSVVPLLIFCIQFLCVFATSESDGYVLNLPLLSFFFSFCSGVTQYGWWYVKLQALTITLAKKKKREILF